MALYLPDADEWLERLDIEVLIRDTVRLQELVAPYTMLIRSRATPREQRWYTFHGIAHMQLHRGNQFYLFRSGDELRLAKQERQAEEWTARTLLPQAELLASIQAGLDEDELAERFQVPTFGVDLAISLLGSEWQAFEHGDGIAGVSRITGPTREEVDDFFANEAENRAFARWLGRTL